MSSNERSEEIVDVLRQALDVLELCNGAETAEGVVIYTGKEITSLRQAIARAERSAEGALDAEKQEPVAWRWQTHNGYAYSEQHYEGEDGQPLYTHPYVPTERQPKRERVVFPTMLRQMWSGGEVQEWLDENVNKEPL